MDAVGYCRVSTADQADGLSIDAQRARCEAWAVAGGHRLLAVEVDAGLSGGRADNRPGLAAAVALACENRAALVVVSLSRLARSVRDTLDLADRLDRAGADLVSLSEAIDTSTAAGRMVFRMLAVLAEFERDLVAERTRQALAHRKAAGLVYGPIPYGRRRDGANLVDDPAQLGTVDQLHRRRAGGASYRQLAAWLAEIGTPAPGGGERWHARTVQRILTRTAPRDP